MENRLNESEINKDYRELIKRPLYITELGKSPYRFQAVLEYAKEESERAFIFNEKVRMNPGNWNFKDINKNRYSDSLKVLELFEAFKSKKLDESNRILIERDLENIRLGKSKHYLSEKWFNLYNDLIKAKYIDTSNETFNDVMNYKKLPAGKEKIKWLTYSSDAMYFQRKIGFTVKQLNECFQNKKGNLFKENNRSMSFNNENDPRPPLPDIIKKHFDTSKPC